MSYTSVTRDYYRFTELGSYKNLVIKDNQPVEKPRATEVLVKVHAVSLNYRDLLISSKSYPIVSKEREEGFVPCSDMAGDIVAAGEDVKDWKVGDRVAANFTQDQVFGEMRPEFASSCLGRQSQGVLTEYRNFPAHIRSLVHVPDHLSFEEAAALPCAAVTAYNALMGGNNLLKAGDWVLIQGTGGVSIFALQIAVASGDSVITNGMGVEYVVEVSGKGSLPKSVNAVQFGGTLSLVGFLSAGKGESFSDYTSSIIQKAINVRGIQNGFRDLMRLISANPESTRPVIDKVFLFEQAVKAYAHLESKKHVGKVVIKVSA